MKRIACLVALGALGCGDDGGSACPTGEVECDGVCIAEIDATLASVHPGVIATSCAVSSSCHTSPATQAEGLALDTVALAKANLIDQASTQDPMRDLVEPSDPDNSYLMNKLDGVNLANRTAGGVSARMPIGALLCEAKLEAVRDWIAAGAPD